MATSTTAHHVPSNPTSSQTGTFYFAYGSNLSAHQMKLRLPYSASSSVAVAVVTLHAHKWIICERGYANVVSTPSTPSNVVWGILYDLHAVDEATLDRYEGHNHERNPEPVLNPDRATSARVPFLQGGWDYNKHYLPVRVEKWLVDPSPYLGGDVKVLAAEEQGGKRVVDALVYVDELRVLDGRINAEYVGRMNRAIDEGVGMGMPMDWVEEVMRRWIPKDIYVHDVGYVGNDGGYDPATERPFEAEVEVRVEVEGDGDAKVVERQGDVVVG